MNTPVNILYIIPRPEIGGAERQLIMLIKGLDRKQFCPHVVCLDGDGSLLQEFQNAADKVIILNRNYPLSPSIITALIRHIRSLRPAVVHTWLYIANLYGGCAAHLAGAPALVVSQRGLGINPQHTPFKIWKMRIFNTLIAQIADRLLVNAKAITEPMWRAGFRPKQTHVVYNGLDLSNQITEDQRALLRKELQIQQGQIILGSVARIDPKKDLITLLRAVAQVARSHPEVRLLVIGGGFPDYLQKLETLVHSLGIKTRVDFLGFRNDAQALLSICDISLLSSITEGLPNALLESMLLGKPIVATSVGGVPELIRNGIEGWLVPPRKPECFANRIIDLIENPDHATRMGAAGRSKAQRNFSSESLVQNTQQIYSELLKKTR